MIARRDFLSAAAALWAAGALRGDDARATPFLSRGVVLVPEDLTLEDWPRRAQQAGLTTIGIHHQNSPRQVIDWVRGPAGRRFLEACRVLKLEVEYELHAMQELLPRDRFAKQPELFRMDERGERVADANCCVHSSAALEIIAAGAVRIAQALRPTTSRYFYWGDDGLPWCACPRCRELSPAEQAVVVENQIVAALRQVDSRATLAHLAYTNTLSPPVKVKPHPALFLEYAPINRRYDVPYARQTEAGAADGLPQLDANLKVFPAETAQVLEYWLDVSKFSAWRRPAQVLPWRREVFLADLDTYRQRGIRHVRSFAAWIDGDYRRRFGEPKFLDEFGAGLAG